MIFNALKFMLLMYSVSAIAQNVEFKRIQWVDLMPKEDVETLYNPPQEIFDITEDEEGEMSEEGFENMMKAMDEDYQKALSSTKVIESLNNQKIEIPGFIVPLIIEGDKTTEFFIVPYFGACMHYPPPPPNQTIFAEYKAGIDISKIYEPYHFLGTLTIFKYQNDIAQSTYHLYIDSIKDFQD